MSIYLTWFMSYKKDPKMAKYIVYTTWYHQKGLRPAEEMRDGMLKNVKPLSPAVDVIWWKMDDNHHQSITIYASEDAAKRHRLEFEEFRKNSSNEYSIKMVEETMGSVIAQMSEL